MIINIHPILVNCGATLCICLLLQLVYVARCWQQEGCRVTSERRDQGLPRARHRHSQPAPQWTHQWGGSTNNTASISKAGATSVKTYLGTGKTSESWGVKEENEKKVRKSLVKIKVCEEEWGWRTPGTRSGTYTGTCGEHCIRAGEYILKELQPMETPC